MELRELQSHWDEHGRTDPLWAILGNESKRYGRWDLGEFFATGRTEIETVMAYLRGLGLPRGRGAALDFGCGIGRLSQALADHFDAVTGVDIAPSMIEGARRHNRAGDRCRFVLNDRDDLSLFPDGSFDLIYSNIVLQHMRPAYSREYIREFVRLLTPEGVAVFQLPSEPTPPATTIRPLPAAAMRARITTDPTAAAVTAGEAVAVQVTVENTGGMTWELGTRAERYMFRLGNHWRKESGELIRQDDIRIELPASVPPGGRFTAPVRTLAPDAPGRYLLEFDMVQEYVSWFATAGSPTATIPVDVSPAVRSGDGAVAAPAIAQIEMYSVPWLEVVKTVAGAGGVVYDIRPDGCAGDDWIGYRYCVGRRPGPGPAERARAQTGADRAPSSN